MIGRIAHDILQDGRGLSPTDETELTDAADGLARDSALNALRSLGSLDGTLFAESIRRVGDPVFANSGTNIAAIADIRLNQVEISGNITALGTTVTRHQTVLVGHVDFTVKGVFQGRPARITIRGFRTYDMETALTTHAQIRTKIYANEDAFLGILDTLVLGFFPG